MYKLIDISTLLTTPSHVAACKVMESAPDLRSISWFYDGSGNWGKFAITRYFAERGACCVSFESANNINYAIKAHIDANGAPRLVIVDLPRD